MLKTYCQGPVCPAPPACDLTPGVYFPPGGGQSPASSMSKVYPGNSTVVAADLEAAGGCSRLDSVTVELTGTTGDNITVTLNGSTITLSRIGDKVTFAGSDDWLVFVDLDATGTITFACYP